MTDQTIPVSIEWLQGLSDKTDKVLEAVKNDASEHRNWPVLMKVSELTGYASVAKLILKNHNKEIIK